jgi:hypothetical protein
MDKQDVPVSGALGHTPAIAAFVPTRERRFRLLLASYPECFCSHAYLVAFASLERFRARAANAGANDEPARQSNDQNCAEYP